MLISLQRKCYHREVGVLPSLFSRALLCTYMDQNEPFRQNNCYCMAHTQLILKSYDYAQIGIKMNLSELLHASEMHYPVHSQELYTHMRITMNLSDHRLLLHGSEMHYPVHSQELYTHMRITMNLSDHRLLLHGSEMHYPVHSQELYTHMRITMNLSDHRLLLHGSEMHYPVNSQELTYRDENEPFRPQICYNMAQRCTT